jgi:acyl carrier protein
LKREELVQEIRELIINTLDLEDGELDNISDNEPLFSEGMDIDSIDLLELAVSIEKKYKVKIGSTENAENIFQTIDTIADFLTENSSVVRK